MRTFIVISRLTRLAFPEWDKYKQNRYISWQIDYREKKH